MSQNNTNAKTAMLAKLDSIHKVEGFDPSPFAVDYTDLNTQETRKRLPATRTRLTAISQRLQRQGARMPPSHLCHRGNGRRRQR